MTAFLTQSSNHTTFWTRLGRAVSWVGSAIAFMLAALAVGLQGWLSSRGYDHASPLALLLLATAATSFLIGRGVRYVLAGE